MILLALACSATLPALRGVSANRDSPVGAPLPDAGGSRGRSASPVEGVIPPASSFVLYHREDDGNIWLLGDAGDAPIMAGAHPRLSPDGRYVVFQTTIWYGDLYVRDLETGSDALLLSAWDVTVGASWTADGSHILFDHGCSIYRVQPDGSNMETIIGVWPATNYCYNDNPDSNPVDDRIAWENGWYGLGLAQADGADPHWIPNTQPDDYSPRWSPDGQWLAFWRDDNVYRIRPDGSELTQLTFLPADVNWMEDTGQWTRSGQYLVAAAQVEGVEGLYAAATDGSGQLTLLLAREWTDPDWVGGAGSVVPGSTIFIDGFESGGIDAWSTASP